MLVTLEGIDGAGKSTVVERMRDGNDIDAVFTHEPTDSWLGDAVERSIHDDGSVPLADLFLFVADHADHIESVVKPALADGEVVVCDRYVDSRYAYQGAVLAERDEDVFEDALGWVQEVHEGWTVVPDLTLLLDLPPDEAVKRLDGGTMKFERTDFLRKVRQKYLKLADDEERFVVVDATQGADEVVGRCVEEVESHTDGY
jgi:dTMP kinase